MSSTISAGTTAGSSLAMAGDTSGSLQLQTNGTTTAVTIDTSQNVGIGTSSPAYKLDITGQGRATTGFAVSTDGSTFTPATLNAIPNYGVGYITSTSQTALSGFGGIPFYTNQLERMRIDSSGNLLFNSGYGSAATAYGCRAWVNFNGTGTVAIRASGNVSSITDNGTGDYTVNFTTAMPDANYCAVSASSKATSSASENQVTQMFNYSTGSIRIGTGVFTGVANVTWTSNDQPIVCVSIFR